MCWQQNRSKRLSTFFWRPCPIISSCAGYSHELWHLTGAQCASGKPKIRVPHPVLVLGRTEFGPQRSGPNTAVLAAADSVFLIFFMRPLPKESPNIVYSFFLFSPRGPSQRILKYVFLLMFFSCFFFSRFLLVFSKWPLPKESPSITFFWIPRFCDSVYNNYPQRQYTCVYKVNGSPHLSHQYIWNSWKGIWNS